MVTTVPFALSSFAVITQLLTESLACFSKITLYVVVGIFALPFVNVTGAGTFGTLLAPGKRIAPPAVIVVAVPKLTSSVTNVVPVAVASALWNVFATLARPSAYCTFCPDTTVGIFTSIAIFVPSCTSIFSFTYAAAFAVKVTSSAFVAKVPVYPVGFPVYFTHSIF